MEMAEQGSRDSSPTEPPGSPDDERSGSTVDEAIAKAEAGSQGEGEHTASDPGATGEHRRAEIRNVEGATEGTVEGNPGGSAEPQPGLSPTEMGSGGAQDIAGGRISDRVAGGQPVPDEPPFGADGEGDTQGSSGAAT